MYICVEHSYHVGPYASEGNCEGHKEETFEGERVRISNNIRNETLQCTGKHASYTLRNVANRPDLRFTKNHETIRVRHIRHKRLGRGRSFGKGRQKFWEHPGERHLVKVIK
jgi:hypothetical protein